MSPRTTLLCVAAIIAALSQPADAFVELSFDVNGQHKYGNDFFMPPWWVGPVNVNVRLRGDQPISSISWNWGISVVGGSGTQTLIYSAPVTHGALFGPTLYTGTAQTGADLKDSFQEGYAIPPLGRLIAPYDAIIATYRLAFNYNDWFYRMVLGTTDKNVATSWTYTYRSGPFEPSQTVSGKPNVVPMEFINIGPEPATACLLAFVGAIAFSRRPGHRR